MVVERRISQVLIEYDIDNIYSDRRFSQVLIECDIDTSVCAISNITPTSGPSGTLITITGVNFEAAQGGGTVTINGATVSVVSWTDTQIVVTVGVGTTTGDVVVTTNGGQVSNPVVFTVTAAPATTGMPMAVSIPGNNAFPFGIVLGNPAVRI